MLANILPFQLLINVDVTMFLFGFFRKRFIIKIILITVVSLIFLIGIIGRRSSPEEATYTPYISINNITRSIENVSYIPSHVSQNGSMLLNVRHICDIPVKNSQVPLAHRFPHFIIIGFGKAGTRALYQMIRMHPDVVGPAHEVRFFSNNLKYSQGLHSYTRLMPATMSSQRTIEKSPDYIINQVAAERLQKALHHCHRNEIKFIVVLREPFKRAVSEYLHWKLTLRHMGKTLKDFERLAIKKSGVVNNILAQVNTSIYSYHIKNWLKVFDMQKMCFVDGDTLVKDPYIILKKLERCLGLGDFIKPKHFYYNKMKGYYCPVDARGKPLCLGSNKGRTHPIIDKDVEIKLRKFYEPYNRELYEITGINFGWT